MASQQYDSPAARLSLIAQRVIAVVIGAVGLCLVAISGLVIAVFIDESRQPQVDRVCEAVGPSISVSGFGIIGLAGLVLAALVWKRDGSKRLGWIAASLLVAGVLVLSIHNGIDQGCLFFD